MPDQAIAHTNVHFFDGAVIAAQPKTGYRAGTDAILLAASIKAGKGERVLELGCGTAVVMMLAAYHNPSAHFTGLEKSGDMLSLARANSENIANIEIVKGSIRQIPHDWHLKFDQLMANPPFFDDRAAVRMSKAKAPSFVNKQGLGIEDWLAAMLICLKPRGYGTLIYRADGIEKVCSHLSGKAGEIRILPIHSYARAPAKRILLRFRKGVKSKSTLLPPLIMHKRESRQRYSPEAMAFLQGKKRIDLA